MGSPWASRGAPQEPQRLSLVVWGAVVCRPRPKQPSAQVRGFRNANPKRGPKSETEIRNEARNPKRMFPGRYSRFLGDTAVSRAIQPFPGSFADWGSFRECVSDSRFGFQVRFGNAFRMSAGSFPDSPGRNAALQGDARPPRVFRGSPCSSGNEARETPSP